MKRVNVEMLAPEIGRFIKPAQTVVGIVGLGYVGLPLLMELAKKYAVVGYDINSQRVKGLQEGSDRNREIADVDIRKCSATFTSSEMDLEGCNFLIVTVPTPINQNNEPDLTCLENAMAVIAKRLKRNDIVVLESTVYPGVTERVCAGILEAGSGLVCNEDFFIGYSPERVNPGDTQYTVSSITKIVSAQDGDVLEHMAEVYGSINNGNIYKAKSIRIAEAAKAIENAQRDINIAFINEITKILNQEDIQIYDVLNAAKTKWNFLDFKPGLVGGHCIGVDPYYLSFYSENLGVKPDVITAGRSTNDGMSEHVAGYITKRLRAYNKNAKRVLLLGFTFKENVNDIRNTKVYALYKALRDEGFDVDVHDPLVDADHMSEYPGLAMRNDLFDAKYDLLALCVPHQVFTENRNFYLSACLNDDGMIFDLKAAWKHDYESGNLKLNYFTL